MGAIVEVTYVGTRVILRRLIQLIWPVNSPLGTEASPSFELVLHGPSGVMYSQPLLGSYREPEPEEATYEEVEGSNSYADLEDEGVCMEEGEDNRLAFWAWAQDYEDETSEEEISWEEEIDEVDLNEASPPEEVWE